MTTLARRRTYRTWSDGGVAWVMPGESCPADGSGPGNEDEQRDALAAVREQLDNPDVTTVVLVDFPAGMLIDEWRQFSEQLLKSGKTLVLRRRDAHPYRADGSERPVYVEPLTERERQVLILACRGYSAREIGQKLFISERTVESHVSNGYRKLGIRSRIQLVRRAVELGL